MPEMIPVANQVTAPDPQKGFGLMSSILGIQQQRQALQTGQYQQSTAQAESQQAQQKNTELQAVGNLTKQAYSSGRYKKSDGSFDNSKFANDVAQVAPTYGQAIANDSTMRAGEIYKNQQTLFNLDQSHRGAIADAFGAWAADPSMDHTKLIDHIENLRAQFKDNPEVSRMLTSMSTAMPNASGPQLQQALRTAAMTAKSPNVDQTNPNIATTQGEGGLQAINTNPQASGGVGPVGAPIRQGIAPQVTQTPTGQLARVGGNGSTLTPLQTASGAGGAPQPNLNQSTAQVETTRGLARGVTDRVSQVQAQANNTVQAQDALNRARAIIEGGERPDTGMGFEAKKGLKNLMASLGIDTQGADDMNTLTKNLARFEASRATASGLGGTDAARELSHNGSPNTQLDGKALQGIVRQSLATERALAGYARLQSQTTDPQKLLENEAKFRDIPHSIETIEYTMSRDKNEAERYLREHGLSHADIARSSQMLKALGVL